MTTTAIAHRIAADFNARLANTLRDIYNLSSWSPDDADGMSEIEGEFMERVAEMTDSLNPHDTYAAYEEADALLQDLARDPIGWAW